VTPAIRISNWREAPKPIPRPVFAIGDVHGRDDLLALLVDAIKAIISENELQNSLLIFLGDYIDRGPDGIAALKRVLDMHSDSEMTCVCLPGNHEQLLWAFLMSQASERRRIFRTWSKNGGSEVARELGMEPERIDMDQFAEAIVQTLGRHRLEKLAMLPNHYRVGDYVFVHAGIHPDFGLSALERGWTQLPRDKDDEDGDPLWVRGPFLTHEADHEQGVIVVHGHTPRSEVELLGNRIGLDTGAYETGRLSAVQLFQTNLRIIQTAPASQGFRWLRYFIRKKS